jgi:hypothetical protein
VSPANNSFGIEYTRKDACYEVLYEVWRATAGALEVDVLLQNILADCNRPIGGIGVFGWMEPPAPECWKSCMGYRSTLGYLGNRETG